MRFVPLWGCNRSSRAGSYAMVLFPLLWRGCFQFGAIVNSGNNIPKQDPQCLYIAIGLRSAGTKGQCVINFIRLPLASIVSINRNMSSPVARFICQSKAMPHTRRLQICSPVYRWWNEMMKG